MNTSCLVGSIALLASDCSCHVCVSDEQATADGRQPFSEGNLFAASSLIHSASHFLLVRLPTADSFETSIRLSRNSEPCPYRALLSDRYT